MEKTYTLRHLRLPLKVISELFFDLFGIIYTVISILNIFPLGFLIVGLLSILAGVLVRLRNSWWPLRFLKLGVSAFFSLTFFVLIYLSFYIYQLSVTAFIFGIFFSLLTLLSLAVLYISAH